MEFYCMKIFPEVALLKFTGWINDFKGSFKWLQYGWSVTWQACCFSSFTSVGCIHQLPAFQKSLRSSRNGSSRLLYAHWMLFLDRFSVINFAYFLFFFRAKREPTSWAAATLSSFQSPKYREYLYQVDVPFKFPRKFYDIWFECEISVLLRFFSESFSIKTTGVFAAYWSSFEGPNIVNPEKKQG